MGNFQTQVLDQPAPAVAGDFCDKNPRHVVDAGPGGLVAGASGVYVGRFAWATFPPDADGAAAIVNYFGDGPVTGFVNRTQGAAMIIQYLADASMLITEGQPVTLFSSGGFWAKNDGATQAIAGQKAFANLLDGTVSFAAAGSTPGGATDSAMANVKTTLTIVGSVADNVLTVTTLSAGKPYPGAVLTSNAVGTVVEQLTNATGPITSANPADYDVGTYLLSINDQTVAAGTTIGGFYGLCTISGGTVTGTFTEGMHITGSSVDTYITHMIGDGVTPTSTFVVASTTAWSAQATTGSSSVETKWYARSNGLAGSLVKISDQVLG